MSEDTNTLKPMIERTIGATVMEYMKNYEPQRLLSQLNQDALQLLEQIRGILNDDSLDDSTCYQKIEAIVTTFHRHGIPTARHDFG